MPSRRRPDPEPTLSIFPDQLHIGDRFTDADSGDEPQEWEVVSRPVTFKKGHEVRARVQRVGDPGTAREKYWAAHERIQVRRNSVLSHASAVIDEEARGREVRRLRLGSAPRGGEAGPHAAPGLRRARVGEGAGQDPSRYLDVVV